MAGDAVWWAGLKKSTMFGSSSERTAMTRAQTITSYRAHMIGLVTSGSAMMLARWTCMLWCRYGSGKHKRAVSFVMWSPAPDVRTEHGIVQQQMDGGERSKSPQTTHDAGECGLLAFLTCAATSFSPSDCQPQNGWTVQQLDAGGHLLTLRWGPSIALFSASRLRLSPACIYLFMESSKLLSRGVDAAVGSMHEACRPAFGCMQQCGTVIGIIVRWVVGSLRRVHRFPRNRCQSVVLVSWWWGRRSCKWRSRWIPITRDGTSRKVGTLKCLFSKAKGSGKLWQFSKVLY